MGKVELVGFVIKFVFLLLLVALLIWWLLGAIGRAVMMYSGGYVLFGIVPHLAVELGIPGGSMRV